MAKTRSQGGKAERIPNVVASETLAYAGLVKHQEMYSRAEILGHIGHS